MERKIPRSLAFDMLFGSNKGDAHDVLDKIYNAHEKEIFNIRQEAQKQISELRVEIDGLRGK